MVDGPRDPADHDLRGIAGFAFLLGFAHEAAFEIIAICTGSEFCPELTTIYALTVVVGVGFVIGLFRASAPSVDDLGEADLLPADRNL